MDYMDFTNKLLEFIQYILIPIMTSAYIYLRKIYNNISRFNDAAKKLDDLQDAIKRLDTLNENIKKLNNTVRFLEVIVLDIADDKAIAKAHKKVKALESNK